MSNNLLGEKPNPKIGLFPKPWRGKRCGSEGEKGAKVLTLEHKCAPVSALHGEGGVRNKRGALPSTPSARAQTKQSTGNKLWDHYVKRTSNLHPPTHADTQCSLFAPSPLPSPALEFYGLDVSRVDASFNRPLILWLLVGLAVAATTLSP